MHTDCLASDIVSAVLDAGWPADYPPTLLELVHVLEIKLRAQRGARLALELEPRPRLTIDSSSPRQDALLAFGVARYLAAIGVQAPVRALAAALSRGCARECRSSAA